VAKPSPPTLPGAQLVLDVPDPGSDITVDRKELRQLWEEELITYKCYNESLILDHQVSTLDNIRDLDKLRLLSHEIKI
jgi:hypothetical protein